MEEKVSVCMCRKSCNEKEKSIKKEDWTKLKHKSLEWNGLHKYSEVLIVFCGGLGDM